MSLYLNTMRRSASDSFLIYERNLQSPLHHGIPTMPRFYMSHHILIFKIKKFLGSFCEMVYLLHQWGTLACAGRGMRVKGPPPPFPRPRHFLPLNSFWPFQFRISAHAPGVGTWKTVVCLFGRQEKPRNIPTTWLINNGRAPRGHTDTQSILQTSFDIHKSGKLFVLGIANDKVDLINKSQDTSHPRENLSFSSLGRRGRP